MVEAQKEVERRQQLLAVEKQKLIEYKRIQAAKKAKYQREILKMTYRKQEEAKEQLI